MARCNVLMVPEWYPWPHRPGLGVWARELAHAVARSHRVVILTFEPSEHAGPLPWRMVDHVEDGLRVVRLHHHPPPLRRLELPLELGGMLHALLRLRRTGFVPDVVHAVVFSAGAPSLALARLSGAPLIVGEHYSGFARDLLTPWDRTVARFTFEHADLVCPASHELAERIARLAPRARVRPMPNVVDTAEFRPAAGATAGAGADANGDAVRMLSVGALEANKGHLHLLDALARMPPRWSQVTLDVVGEGPDREAIERRRSELGLDGRVRLLGGRSKRDVAELMRGADLFVLPSLWENAPVTLLEAMASGLPSVASRVGGVGEILDHETGVLVPAGDPDALAVALEYVSEHRGDYDPATLARRAEERFGPAAVVARWSATYEDAIELRRARSLRVRVRP